MFDYSIGTVVSSRIRLARNLNGYPFPAKLKSDKQAKQIIRAVSSAVNRVGEFRLLYMDDLPEDEALNLVENRKISQVLLKRPSYSAVLINDEGNLSIMINEEDHLREQCIGKGLSVRECYALMSEKDSLIARSIPFAYDEQFGYLTACPTNLGTGLRASVMMFLPALAMKGVMPDVIKSALRLGLTVRGAYGEGSSAEGYIYQVSNEVTLGVTEEEIMSQVETIVGKIVDMEAMWREELKHGENAIMLKDKCLRAYGVLRSCAYIGHEEFDDLCTYLKLGVCLGYLHATDVNDVYELEINMKPSNVNVLAGRQMTSAERAEYRAKYASSAIKKIITEI